MSFSAASSRRPLVERALDIAGIPKAFRPEPLIAEEMAEFYSEALDRQRGNHLLRRIKDDMLESAEQGFFFKGVLYGNRGIGNLPKSTASLTTRPLNRNSLSSA